MKTCPRCASLVNRTRPVFCLNCGWHDAAPEQPLTHVGGPPGMEHFPEWFDNTGAQEAYEDEMHAVCGMDDAGDR